MWTPHIRQDPAAKGMKARQAKLKRLVADARRASPKDDLDRLIVRRFGKKH